jgi:hypothetical protein
LSASWRRLKNPGEIQNLPSVKDVKLVVRSYETRTAFCDLTNRIIYHEYLVDDEEVAEYLIFRELIHKAQHVHFEIRRLVLREEVRPSFMSREKVEGIGEDGKAERGEQEASATSFFSGGRQLRVPLAAYVAFLNRLYDAKEGWSKARSPMLTESQKR